MFIVFGVIGLLVISYSIWIKNERKQDILFVAGGVCLLIYSVSRHDPIFIVLQIVFIISALIEMVKLSKKKKDRG